MERKPCLALMLCSTIVLIMSMLAYIHLKKELVNKLSNELGLVESAVQDSKRDIENYNAAIEQTEKETGIADKETKELQDEVGKLTSAKAEKDKVVKECKDSLPALNNGITAVEKEKSDTDVNFAGEKTKWSDAINGFKKQLQDRSPICDHAKILPKHIKEDPTLKDLCNENVLSQTTVKAV